MYARSKEIEEHINIKMCEQRVSESTMQILVKMYILNVVSRIYSRSLSVECGTATASARMTEIVASCDPSSRKASI